VDNPKNPHAVALGRLGGAKGGKARAKVLSAARRRQIAAEGAHARAAALGPAERSAIARKAVRARWARQLTGLDTPPAVRRLLKSYKPAALRWRVPDERYAIVREVLVRGNADAHAWLTQMMAPDELRELVRQYRGAGCSEPERQALRDRFGLTTADIPARDYLGAWRA
jgi:hypothetical protein